MNFFGIKPRSMDSVLAKLSSGRRLLPFSVALCCMALNGCASDAAKTYAQQSEAAQLRQQVEEKVDVALKLRVQFVPILTLDDVIRIPRFTERKGCERQSALSARADAAHPTRAEIVDNLFVAEVAEMRFEIRS